MNVKSLVSALTLSAALGFSGAAFAQTTTTTTEAAPTMIGSMTVSEADLPAVTQRCNELVTSASSESLSETTSEGDDDGSDDSTTGTTDAGSADATINDAPGVNEAEEATSAVQLDSVTLQQCQEAGLGN